MDDLKRVGLIFKSDGSTDFVKTLKEVNLELNSNYNQFKLTQAQWDESTTKVEKLSAQLEYLTIAYDTQYDKVTILKSQLAELESEENKNASAIKKKRQELLNAELQLTKYDRKVKDASTSLQNAKNGILTTAEKIEELDNKMKENESTFRLAQSQYDAITSKTQKLKDEQNYLTNAYDMQKQKIDLLNQELSELENQEDKNTIAISKKKVEIAKAQTELNSYNVRLKEVKNSLESLNAKAIDVGEKIENIGDKMEKAGSKLSAFSTATITALVGAAKSSIDFEDAMTGVYKTIDGTDEQLNEITQGIRNMAKEIPASTTEIAGVAESAGQLGIATEDILSFTRTMIDLGNATNLSADEAASSLAKFANITNMSAKDYNRLGSVIVALGNNFATTEADIVSMATRLASTGELTGLSQSQIMALATAMSSVGIEAEAGGSAMSKLLKKIQVATETGGTSLKQFAKVSGMSTSQFKKAFQEDAVGALSSFLGGLQDTKRNGKSAIAVLEDMNIKEVNLSNTILSLSNASSLMNKAVSTANNAWEDNNALTEETNKRYENLKSKIIIAVNKLKDLVITFGNKLTPAIDKGTNYIEKLMKTVENLSDKDVDMIINIGKTVAAIGPLLVVIGKITSVGGTAIKTVGTFVQAIGVMKGTVTTSSTAVNGLAGILTKLISPAGLVTTTILATAGAVAYLALKQSDEVKASEELANKAIECKNRMDEYNKSIDESASAELAHIDAVSRLKNELYSLVDENGKVKEGEEGRVKFILSELNNALGTEYKLNNNIVKNYKDLQNEIDGTIEKKRAKIKLDAEESKYKNAIEQQTEAVEGMKNAQEILGMSYEDAKKKIDDYNKKTEDMIMLRGEFAGLGKQELDRRKGELLLQSDEIEQLKNHVKAYEGYKSTVETCTNDIKKYEDDYVKYTQEKYEEIGNSIKVATKDWTDSTLDEIKNGINEQGNALQQYKEIYNRTGNELSALNYEQAQKNLEQLATQLADRTLRINELGQQETDAWKSLSTNNYDVYQKELAKMTPEMQQKIADVTGVIYEKTPDVSSATEFMSSEIISRLDNDEEFRNEALSSMYEYLNGLTNSELRSLLETAGVQDVDRVMQGIKSGNLAEEEGKNILTSLNNGLSSGYFQGSLFKTASGIAKGIADRLSVKFNISGVANAFKAITGFLPGHKLGLDYVPKDNYVARLHRGERVLTAEENKEYTEAEEESKRRNGGSSVNVVDSSSIADAIIESNSQVISLLKQLINISSQKQQLVLDTGVLVGETVTKMDEELGRLSDRRKRGS